MSREFIKLEEDSPVSLIKDLMWLIESEAGGPANVQTTDILDWLSDPQYNVYVLYDNGNIRGVAVMFLTENAEPKPEDAMLDVLLVHKRHRRAGHGKWMVNDLRRMFDLGFIVRTDIPAAIDFYVREGFRRHSQTLHLLTPGVLGTTFIHTKAKRRAQ